MDWKKLGKNFIFPPLMLIIPLTLFSIFALIYIFLHNLTNTPFAYCMYGLSFYAVTVDTIFIALRLPKYHKFFKQKLYDNPLGNRYLTDLAFRTHVSLALSLVINLLYAALNLAAYQLYHSIWFIVLAVYYGILAIMRSLLIHYARKTGIGNNHLGEAKITLICSCLLLTLNFVLSGAILMMLYQNKGFAYSGFLIYAAAAYTFYITIQAIVNLIRYRKYHSPVMTMTKIISLSAALVSMLALETAMFAQFGQRMAVENQQLMIILTGAGISAAVIAMSSYMIVHCTKEMKNHISNLKN